MLTVSLLVFGHCSSLSGVGGLGVSSVRVVGALYPVVCSSSGSLIMVSRFILVSVSSLGSVASSTVHSSSSSFSFRLSISVFMLWCLVM